ncbi:E3 ubiquitin-protein ligase xbat33 [Castilleja foliolosa]|uniref:E3 ubiquitin-protein ligase xbat33 n=1 Tax=Castilleja foliolosa TaxID=1961234 RepID=A0ABD3E2N4_9LAMI
MLLDCNPCLAKYSTFGGLNSPLHFASAKGIIVALLLENGADVNSRNYCGQVPLWFEVLVDWGTSIDASVPIRAIGSCSNSSSF